MNKKYVKVHVKERLPEKEGCYPIIFKNTDIIRDYYRGKNILSEEFWKIHIEYWLEEKEDHSEEMLSLLEELISLKHLKDTDGKTPYYLERQPKAWEKAKNLINKVKDNGK
ncbi:hypothetical protein CMT77_07935 [Elizabethkingia anophelis]|nr:hypothetical protein [Elizabethkingia anophelis]